MREKVRGLLRYGSHPAAARSPAYVVVAWWLGGGCYADEVGRTLELSLV